MQSLVELKEFINGQIKDLPLPIEPKGLYEPFRYIMELGGKRIRPAMLILAGKAYHGTETELRDAAMAVEVFHNFSLVHDDIMDEAPKRRGKETVHTKWDENIAILTGDVMLIEAYKYLGRLSDRAFKPCFEVFSHSAVEVCEGQVKDLEFENLKEVKVEDYIEMIRQKTAALVGASLKMGAIIGGADKSEAEKIYRFGEYLGISFQIKDDLLDAFPEGENFGKKEGGDILANKKTYLFLKALELANEEDKAELLNWFAKRELSNPEEKVKRVKEIFERSGARKATTEIMLDYYHRALNALAETNMQDEYKDQFEELAGFLADRIS
ncbi:polyprenyl synthetase family protein [Luteibaculum oceani]|uniref:Polyprenyl synthetase family protein n=1 Tax=Luteibaculum oceani TaxID=1294296 RepID=A0A5C6UZV8_9FLAO|nr:polyprenyl synthetase family protein [Luteibaculum oceani]TXC78932.1 polyprenyl synthetase family protein [Luteibaculum oceani]